jgi:hypothetical protein
MNEEAVDADADCAPGHDTTFGLDGRSSRVGQMLCAALAADVEVVVVPAGGSGSAQKKGGRVKSCHPRPPSQTSLKETPDCSLHVGRVEGRLYGLCRF